MDCSNVRTQGVRRGTTGLWGRLYYRTAGRCPCRRGCECVPHRAALYDIKLGTFRFVQPSFFPHSNKLASQLFLHMLNAFMFSRTYKEIHIATVSKDLCVSRISHALADLGCNYMCLPNGTARADAVGHCKEMAGEQP